MKRLVLLACTLVLMSSAALADGALPPQTVPEPGILALLAAGATGIILARRRRK